VIGIKIINLSRDYNNSVVIAIDLRLCITSSNFNYSNPVSRSEYF
jgi:hypothetical protein